MSGGGRRAAHKDQAKESEPKTRRDEGSPLPRWHVIPPERLLVSGKSEEELQSLLSEELGLTSSHSCMREAALLQYYLQGLCWARDAHLSSLQASFVMAVLDKMVHNITEKNMALVDNGLEFAKALAAACQRPITEENLCPLLSLEEAQALIGFITVCLFQKYQLYEILLRSEQEELLLGSQRTVELLSLDTLSALEEGIPSHLFPPDSLS